MMRRAKRAFYELLKGSSIPHTPACSLGSSSLELVLRSCLTRVWSALTVMTHFDEKQCTIDVLRVLSNPVDLGMDPADLKHDVVEAAMEPDRGGPAANRRIAGPVGMDFVSLTD